MHSEIELKAFELIDNFLQHLVDKGSGNAYEISNDFYSTPTQIAFKIMSDKEFISFRKGYPDKDSIVDISTNGLHILKIGGYKSYLDALENQAQLDNYKQKLEIEKAKTDLELAKRMLKEYPLTKWTARIGFIIALGLAILELIKFIRKQ